MFSKYKLFLGILLLISSGRSPATDTSEDYWRHNTKSTQSDASDVALPLLSLVLPGAGQWARGQWTAGALYSGLSLGATSYALQSQREFGKSKIKSSELAGSNVAARKYILGLQTSQAVGGISLYHSFRTAVWQRQKFGDYAFLDSGDSPIDHRLPIERKAEA